MTQGMITSLSLSEGRTHEVCGPGALVFAFAMAARLGGQVIWVRQAHNHDQINPVGFAEFVDPADLLICCAKDNKEVLAVAEDALRSGAAKLVVLEPAKALGLTEGRRLQLAARDGAATGLAIIAEDMGSNAAETRWRCAPVFDPQDSTLQQWERIKNKSGTLGVWYVRWDAASRRFTVVSPAGE